MSMATLEREIAFELRKLANNPKIKVKDIMEWNTSEIQPHDGEVVFRIPGLCFAAIKKELVKP